MTAPAPTPADLARRTPPVKTPPGDITAAPATRREPTAPADPAAAAVAPGRLHRHEHFRRYFMLGLRASRMHAHARLVGHDLMWRASHSTGRIGLGQRAGIDDLAAATALAPRQVEVALQNLHSRGWIRTERPVNDSGRTGRPVVVAVTIPAAVLQQIRAEPRPPAAR